MAKFIYLLCTLFFFIHLLSPSVSIAMMKPLRMSVVPSGLLAVYKPKTWTSNDVVTKFKIILQEGARKITNSKQKIKVGHGGTLDPLAEGVLVLGVGAGTTLLQTYLSGSKGYHARARLGFETDTLDITGTMTESLENPDIQLRTLEEALPKFRGDITQIPPMYSALKRDGKKLYELARKGIEVEREARPVSVYHLEILKENAPDLPHFALDIECSGGFYVRSLIADLARSCGGRAHMTDLLRTKQGVFTLKDCICEPRWEFTQIIEQIEKNSALAGINIHDLRPAC